ncbi:MAG: 50S ribosomal protein L18, partial [Candidatus Wolfebacteria bacterium]|nr:50S ribosomal protein L18 [Candidatus Wolfebacteria bacterium]
MKKVKALNKTREIRKKRSRFRLFGTENKPRLSVFRSNQWSYAQLIDDKNGKTLASASTKGMKKTTGDKN